MRRALISDIHGNVEALEAVLADIKAQRINEIFCFGDIVGYGPNPRTCIDRVIKTCRVTLLGNHDQAASSDVARLKRPSQLDDASDQAANEIRKSFLAHLPLTHEIGPYLFVHGSPRNPLSEYVFPEDIYNRRKMEHPSTCLNRQGRERLMSTTEGRPTGVRHKLDGASFIARDAGVREPWPTASGVRSGGNGRAPKSLQGSD